MIARIAPRVVVTCRVVYLSYQLLRRLAQPLPSSRQRTAGAQLAWRPLPACTLSTLPRAASFASLAGPQSCGRSGQVGVGQGVCHSDIAQEHFAILWMVGYGTAGRRQATLLTLRLADAITDRIVQQLSSPCLRQCRTSEAGVRVASLEWRELRETASHCECCSSPAVQAVES